MKECSRNAGLGSAETDQTFLRRQSVQSCPGCDIGTWTQQQTLTSTARHTPGHGSCSLQKWLDKLKRTPLNQRCSNRTGLCFTWAGLPVVADAVDNVVGHSGVLRHRQHVVPGAGDRVPHQEDPVPLPLEEGNRVLAAQSAPVPAASVFRVKITGHGGCEIPVCPRLDALSSAASSFIRNSCKTLFYRLSRLEVNATPRIPNETFTLPEGLLQKHDCFKNTT